MSNLLNKFESMDWKIKFKKMIGSCRVHDFPCHESISQFSSVFIHFLHFSVTGFWRVHEREPFDSYFTKSSNWWSSSNWKRCVSQKFHLTFIHFFLLFSEGKFSIVALLEHIMQFTCLRHRTSDDWNIIKLFTLIN